MGGLFSSVTNPPGGDENDVQINSGSSTFAGSDLLEFNQFLLSLSGAFTQFIDITQPPVFVSELTGITGAADMDEFGGYIYVCQTGSDEVIVVDVTQPATPIIVGSVVNGEALNGDTQCFANGRYCYVTSPTGNSFTIIDTKDPANPVIVGNVIDATDLEDVRGISVVGQYAFLTTGVNANARLTVVDVSNEAAPIIIASIQPDATFIRSTSNVIWGQYLVANGGAHLHILDISDPYNPTYVSGFTTGDNRTTGSRDVKVIGSTAYMTTTSGHLTTIDISDPTTMVLLGSTDNANETELSGAWGLAVDGRFAYIACEDTDAVSIVDVADTTNPFFLNQYIDAVNLDNPTAVIISAGFAFASATVSSTFQVLSINGFAALSAFLGTASTNMLEVFNEAKFGGTVSMRNGLSVGGSIDSFDDMHAPSFNLLDLEKTKVVGEFAFTVGGAGNYNADGTSNMTNGSYILMGQDAGGALTSGTNLIAIGRGAGQNITEGGNNIFIGINAGRDMTETSDISNVIIGTGSFDSCIEGEKNTVIGEGAGTNVTGIANNNVIIGRGAAPTLIDGQGNIIIGPDTTDVPAASTSQFVNIGDLFYGQRTPGDKLARIGGLPTDALIPNVSLELFDDDKALLLNRLASPAFESLSTVGMFGFDIDADCLRVITDSFIFRYASKQINNRYIRALTDMPAAIAGVITLGGVNVVEVQELDLGTDRIQLDAGAMLTALSAKTTQIVSSNASGTVVAEGTGINIISNVQVINTTTFAIRCDNAAGVYILDGLAQIGGDSDIEIGAFLGLQIERSGITDCTLTFTDDSGAGSRFQSNDNVYTTVAAASIIVVNANVDLGDWDFFAPQFNLFNAGAVGIDLSAAGITIERGSIVGGQVGGPGTFTAGFDESSDEWSFENIDGNADSADQIVTQALPLVTSLGTLSLVEDVWTDIDDGGIDLTYSARPGNEKFTLTDLDNGEVTYNGVRSREYSVGGVLGFDGVSTTFVDVGISLNGADPLEFTLVRISTTGTQRGSLTIPGIAFSLAPADTLKLMIRLSESVDIDIVQAKLTVSL